MKRTEKPIASRRDTIKPMQPQDLGNKKVLVGCEFSGVTRDAFAALGWDAWSCDILSSEKPGKHYKKDLREVLSLHNWDLMIAFPPCTYLSSVQTFLCRKDAQRVKSRIEAAAFFMELFTADIPHIAVENPCGVMNHIFREPDQIVHPYYFGDTVMKRTGLWLKDLPVLVHRRSADLFGNEATYGEVPPPSKTWVQKSTGKVKYMRQVNQIMLTGHERSRLSPFLAKAMAEQWTDYILNNKNHNNEQKNNQRTN